MAAKQSARRATPRRGPLPTSAEAFEGPRPAGDPSAPPPAIGSARLDLLRSEETDFFRDPGAWSFLAEQVLPVVVRQKKPEEPIRAWVPGCGTGQAAYSLAMLLIEQAEAAGAEGEIRVFATGADPEALEAARAGLYPAAIASAVAPARLDQFFIPEEGRYRVSRRLRHAVAFAAHDLIAAPPFSELDLICCRGLAAVLEPEAWDTAVRLFHRALRRGGTLFLGASETVGEQEDIFEAVSEPWRIYRRIGPTHRELFSITLAAAILDRRFCVRRFTPAMTRLFPLTPADVGRPLEDLMQMVADPDLRRDAEAALAALAPLSREIRTPEGRWFIRRVLPSSFVAERPEGVVVTFEEVTSLKQAERAAQEARTYAEAIVATVHEPLVVLDPDLRIKSANASFHRSFRTSPAEAEGRPFFDLWDQPRALPRLQEALRRVLRDNASLDDVEVDLDVGPLGRRTMRLNARRLEQMPLILLALEDITERKRLEKEVLEIAAAEQRRIGQELHDNTGQVLTGLGLMARVLVDRLAGKRPPECRIATKIVDGIGQALEQLRMIVKGLVPVEVDAAGLMAALADLAALTGELGGVSCRFACAAPVCVRDNPTAVHLYRIAQESVTNALKHGRAGQIRISLRRDGDQILLEIQDDGRGLPEPPDGGAGTGLRIMRYRAGLIGATLVIGPAEGGGTLVRCTCREVEHHG